MSIHVSAATDMHIRIAELLRKVLLIARVEKEFPLLEAATK
jgi:hypothetical protein